jgi:hypothetical protein
MTIARWIDVFAVALVDFSCDFIATFPFFDALAINSRFDCRECPRVNFINHSDDKSEIAIEGAFQHIAAGAVP